MEPIIKPKQKRTYTKKQNQNKSTFAFSISGFQANQLCDNLVGFILEFLTVFECLELVKSNIVRVGLPIFKHRIQKFEVDVSEWLAFSKWCPNYYQSFEVYGGKEKKRDLEFIWGFKRKSRAFKSMDDIMYAIFKQHNNFQNFKNIRNIKIKSDIEIMKHTISLNLNIAYYNLDKFFNSSYMDPLIKYYLDNPEFMIDYPNHEYITNFCVDVKEKISSTIDHRMIDDLKKRLKMVKKEFNSIRRDMISMDSSFVMEFGIPYVRSIIKSDITYDTFTL